MAGQGDRSGKKPKYTIRDIGGVELSSEDKPTERVLNFLMRGQGPTDQPAPEPTHPEISRSSEVEIPLARTADSDSPPKRSLDSLFERAGAASAASLDPSVEQPLEPIKPSSLPNDVTSSLPSKTRTKSTTVDREHGEDTRDAGTVGTHPQIPEDLVALLDEVRKKRRLNRGEFKILMALSLACREAKSDRCYIKIAQLMSDADLKERHTQMMLRSLQQLGLIERVAEYSNLDRLGTQYLVRFDLF